MTARTGPHNEVIGLCPGCDRSGSLFLASGGYVTCGHLDCPDPTAADRLLSMGVRRDRLNEFHTVILDQSGWKLAHPMTCDLAACPYDAIAHSWDSQPRTDGTYEWHHATDRPADWDEARA